MHAQSVLLFLGVAWLASAAPAPKPLNINLGAYSPALVVGDGAISFAGAKEGAGRAGGEAAGAAAPAAEAVQAAQVAEVPQTANGVVSPDQVVASEQTPVTAQDTTLLQGMGKQRLPKE